MVAQLVDPIITLSWIHISMRWNSLGDEIIESTAFIIAGSMCTQYNVDGIKYLLLDLFIDHKKDDSTLSVDNQRVLVKERETFRKSTDS